MELVTITAKEHRLIADWMNSKMPELARALFNVDKVQKI